MGISFIPTRQAIGTIMSNVGPSERALDDERSTGNIKQTENGSCNDKERRSTVL